MLLRYVYIIFIGVLLALFVAVGIDAFHKAPKYPDPPRAITTPIRSETASMSAEETVNIEKYEKESRDFQTKTEKYNRDVSVVALFFALTFLVIGLVFTRQLSLIADGFLVGGVLTLLYSVARSFSGNDDVYRFIAVSIALVVALLLGYLKFIRNKTDLAK